MRKLALPLLFFSVCLFLSCNKNVKTVTVPANYSTETEFTESVSEYGIYNELAFRLAENFDDRRLAAQVIISGVDGRGQLIQDMKILLTECPAGGIMLFRYNLDAGNDAIQEMIAGISELIESESSIRPFVAADHEGGAVNRFRPGVADLPAASSYWETAQIKGKNAAVTQIAADSYYAGKTIGALGINMNFAPVAEYLNQYNNVFLADRSFGPDPAFAADAAAAFIAGMDLAGILCAAKHFPGSAGTDPHYFSSVLPGGREAVAAFAAPFESLVFDGRARAIIVSHTLVPAVDSNNIASLSRTVLDGWLRQEWGFEGIIICDDFSMASARSQASEGSLGASGQRPETLAVQSLAAGADMILVWPPDLRRTHREIQAALIDGRLSSDRLREAAGRILAQKIRLGLISKEQRALER